MEIAELNNLLATLSPSEEHYRLGERYAWDSIPAPEGDAAPLRLGAEGESLLAHQSPCVSNDSMPPLLGSLALRRTSRFNPCPEHVHTHIEVSYTYAGSCPQTIDGRAVTLEENQVLLLDTDCPHSTGELEASDIHLSLMLSKDFLRRNLLDAFSQESIVSKFLVNALNDETNHNHYVHFHTQDSRRVRRYFQEIMCEYYDPSANADHIIENLLELFFAELISVYEQDYRRRDESRGAVSIIPIIRYIETHYRTCTLRSVAEHFAISPNYVSELLKRHTGMTYVQAVQAQRLGHAASLLRRTDRTVGDIAHEVGYENQSFFYRKFREQYGCLPAAYRAEYRNRP